MKDIFRILVSSILSGILIGLGGIAYIFCKGSFINGVIIGSFLFSIGLLLIISYKLDLFTGKVCYFFKNNYKYKIFLIVILLGNLIGAIGIGYLARLTNNDLLISNALNIVNYKLSIGLLTALIMSFFCGIMIFLAVDTAKRSSNQFFKSLIVVMCIMIFVLSGFEHSIANTFYYSLANVWNLNTIFYLLVIIGGNSLGGIFLPSLFSIIDKLSKWLNWEEGVKYVINYR